MITSIEIENYRGIAEAKIAGLRRFTVLTGANNSGKTSVLESLAAVESVHSSDGPSNSVIAAIVGHRQLRGDPRPSLRLDPTKPAWLRSNIGGAVIHDRTNLTLETDQGANRIEITNGPASITYHRSKSLCFIAAPTPSDPAALEMAVSEAERLGYRKMVVEAARLVDSSITDLRILVDPHPVLYTESDTGSERASVWPVAVGGTGFKRYLTLAAQLAGFKGLVCLDDPDAFLHPGLFRHVAALLWKLVESGSQVVIATHSPELINVLAQDVNGEPRAPLFGVYGLQRSRVGHVTCTLRLHGQQAQNTRRIDAIRDLLGLT